jgi:hypothetical protein
MSAPVKDLGPKIPLDQHRREKAAAIKLWTRHNLPLTDETIVSVNEFACIKPDCPKRQTVILLLSEHAPTKKISIRKTIDDVCETDVFDGCLELLRNWED